MYNNLFQGIRGAVRPLLKLRVTNTSPGLGPRSHPTVVAYAREFVKSGAHVRVREVSTSPQIWVILEWVLIGGLFSLREWGSGLYEFVFVIA